LNALNYWSAANVICAFNTKSVDNVRKRTVSENVWCNCAGIKGDGEIWRTVHRPWRSNHGLDMLFCGFI